MGYSVMSLKNDTESSQSQKATNYMIPFLETSRKCQSTETRVVV